MYLLPRDTAVAFADLAKRRTCYYDSFGYYTCRSSWTSWGRWVLAGILLFIGVFLLLIVLFCSRRRRLRNRRFGQSTPMVSQPPAGGYNQQYAGGPQYGAPPGPPPTYGNAGYDGYYGQQGGVTQPANTYKP